MRGSPAEYLRLDLRAHDLLRDVPVYDVSVVDLPGGGAGRSLADIRALESAASPSPAASAIYGLRVVLGRAFGWDRARIRPEDSLLSRLSGRDRRDSEIAPGTWEGSFLVLYQFPGEALSEIRNATVHGFMCKALARTATGYRLYWGIYVIPVSWLTRPYLIAIVPFRRICPRCFVGSGGRNCRLRRHEMRSPRPRRRRTIQGGFTLSGTRPSSSSRIGKRYIFDSFECAIHKLAVSCDHCGCKVVGHGVEAHGRFCRAHCARELGGRRLRPGGVGDDAVSVGSLRQAPGRLRLRPDPSRRRCSGYGHWPVLLPLHDAQLGADPAAVLLELDAAIGEVFRRAVLEVDLVQRLGQLLVVRGGRRSRAL